VNARVWLLRAFALCLLLVCLPRAAFAQTPGGFHQGDPRELSEPQADQLQPAADLPVGSIEAVIVDGNEKPIPNLEVRLGILFQTIAEGEKRTAKTAKTNEHGVVRFDGLTTGSSYSYRISAKNGLGEYGSSPFNLKDTGGMRALLHVFPASSDVSVAVVGLRGFLYFETRDDVFQVEALFRVINLGRVAWVPQDVVMELPHGWKAFNAGEAMTDARFEPVEGRGVRLVGTYPPGQRDVSFRFQLPKGSSGSATFRVRPPPRVAEMRVIAVASQHMGLEVPDWEAPREGTGPRGDRVLVTRKVVSRGADEIREFSVRLTGLPVPGPGRWIASSIALAFGLCGWAAATGKLRLVSQERAQGDRARARELLLAELVELTRARERNEIGPTTYERTQRMLVDALARIGLPSEPKRAKKSPKTQRA
jgi:hypothetical protein